LTAQQQGILQEVLAGKSVFVTGSAGTGKSVLVRAIIAEFGRRESARIAKKKAGEEVKAQNWRLGVTSSTGLSAL
jgi:ATP-dependent DNA helicase PIF1